MRGLKGVLLTAGLLTLVGCRNCDLLESELRTRETELYHLRADLAYAEDQNEALVRELRTVRQNGSSKITPELASQTYSLRQIVLGRGTGGYDEDGRPGDEALQVVLEPRDPDGHTIKTPGSVHVEALQISPEGLKIPLSAWDLTPDQLRRTWRSGLISTGYFLVLPWKNWPTSEKVRVIVQFTLADGRVFETDKDVTVRVAPENQRKPGPVIDAAPPALGPTLPVPRKLDVKESTSAKAWWLLPPGEPDPPPQPAAWRPKAGPSLIDSVQLERPVVLTREAGDEASW